MCTSNLKHQLSGTWENLPISYDNLFLRPFSAPFAKKLKTRSTLHSESTYRTHKPSNSRVWKLLSAFTCLQVKHLFSRFNLKISKQWKSRGIFLLILWRTLYGNVFITKLNFLSVRQLEIYVYNVASREESGITELYSEMKVISKI